MVTSILKKLAAIFFRVVQEGYLEDEASKLLQNVVQYLPVSMAP
jgi:hypothetical protein